MVQKLLLSATLVFILQVIYVQCNLHEYNGDTYFFSNPIKKSWHQAYTFCSDKNMDLLFIESKEENDYITNLVRSSPEYSRPGNNYWIGATDLGSEEDWYWLSTGKHVDYSNWSVSQPSPLEHCVHLWDATNFLWNNIWCGLELHFICKAKPCSGFAITPRM